MNRHFRAAIGTLPRRTCHSVATEAADVRAQTDRIAILYRTAHVPRTCGCASPRVRAGCVCDSARRGRRAVSTAVDGLFTAGAATRRTPVPAVAGNAARAVSGFRCAVVIIDIVFEHVLAPAVRL